MIVTVEDNDTLTTPISIDELEATAFSMKSDKCPGPDGLNLGFYQIFWDTCVCFLTNKSLDACFLKVEICSFLFLRQNGH